MQMVTSDPASSYPHVHAQLVATGWFSSIIGPEGGWPTQMYGYLRTGDRFIFTSRASLARLTVYHGDSDLVKRECRREFPFPEASFLPGELCLSLMRQWLVGE